MSLHQIKSLARASTTSLPFVLNMFTSLNFFLVNQQITSTNEVTRALSFKPIATSHVIGIHTIGKTTVIQLNSIENVTVQKLYIMNVCSYYVKCIVIYCSFCLLLKQPHFVLLHQWPQTLCHWLLHIDDSIFDFHVCKSNSFAEVQNLICIWFRMLQRWVLLCVFLKPVD